MSPLRPITEQTPQPSPKPASRARRATLKGPAKGIIFGSMPDTHNPWRLLQANQGDEAVALLREQFKRQPTPGYSLSLGAALMWVGDYGRAHEHFQASLHTAKQRRMGSELDYAFLGAAEWCTDNDSAAIRCWLAGRTAPYAVVGVCLQTPMLLLTGSILRPELPLNANAILSELKEKLKDPRTNTWPGTLGQFVAGLKSIEAVQSSWIGTREQNEKGILPTCRWITDFYRNLLDLREGQISPQQFKEAAATLASPTCRASSDEDEFVRLVRCPEFYIARHESPA